jgi:hypothetical protein
MHTEEADRAVAEVVRRHPDGGCGLGFTLLVDFKGETDGAA